MINPNTPPSLEDNSHWFYEAVSVGFCLALIISLVVAAVQS